MKAINRYSLLTACILLASCGSRKHAVETAGTPSEGQTVVVAPDQESSQPSEAKPQEQTCVTARLRMELSYGSNDVSLGGTLRMKRDDVIQLSVVTFGILEVARIEMTPDYFLFVDKMGRRYVKAGYGEVDFLREAGVDFNTIQSYFWDEQATDVAAWERSGYVAVGNRRLPTRHNITIHTGSRTVKANLTLSGLSADSNWEKRTDVPSRYSQVPVDELLTRIMNQLK